MNDLFQFSHNEIRKKYNNKKENNNKIQQLQHPWG